ncbi:SRPBCC domain-containing protein [Leifsonia aquatica]|uniref:SRPBCC domain-containing protein n=1 Tax=Leifsonia aquatica TaxID=144185 RepID=UPI00380DB708
MEYGSIERKVYIDAVPEVVVDAISRPEHIQKWWPDEAALDCRPGGVGEMCGKGQGTHPSAVFAITVVEVVPLVRFSLRWAYASDVGEPDVSSSFLVTFKLAAAGSGTLVKFVETGFREQGWEAALLEATYLDHVEGWNRFLSQLVAYAERPVSVP